MIELKKNEQTDIKYEKNLKYLSKNNDSRDGRALTEKQEKKARKVAAKIAKETKNLTFPQLLEEWENAIFKIYMYNDKPVDELKDLIALMKMRKKEKDTNVIAAKIRGKKYSVKLLIALLFTVAYFCKDGPDLYRKIFGNKVPLSIEKDLKDFEHNHKVYQYQIDNGMSK